MVDSHWAKQKERGSYLGIKTLLVFYRYGGRTLVKAGLVPVLLYFFLTSGAARKASLEFLRRVFDYYGPSTQLQRMPGWGKSFQHFWQFAQSALDKVDAWVGQIRLNDLDLGAVERYEEQVQRSKGAILIASHVGNIEVCRALVKERFSTRLNVLVFTQHAARFNRVLKEVNPNVDVDLIQATNITPDLVIMLKGRVEAGESVVIVGDRVAVDSPHQVVWANFLGRPAPFAIGPWVLASVLECPVYFISCMLVGRSYRLNIEHVTDQIELPRSERTARIQSFAQRYAEHLELMAREYPLQWYNFFNFWCLPKR